MSTLDLQQLLIKRLEKIFDGQQFLKPREDITLTAEYVPLNIYSQSLPYKDDVDTDGRDYAPYIAVQLHEGKYEDENEPQDVTLLINIGIFDDDKSNQGHVTVLNIIETIRQNLFFSRLLGGKYYIKLPFNWQLGEDDIWPFAVGSIETHWNLPITAPDDINL